VDFAEELAGEEPGAAEHADLAGVSAALQALVESYRQGRRLDGVVVALVGPVNAGKSSLFNALLGRERALVASEPGTTRDYLEAEVCWEGQRVTLVDTAGERAVSSSLELAGQALAAPLLQRCELKLHVLDASAMPDASAGLDTEGIQVANKVDLLSAARRGELSEALVATSALDGTGLDRLRQCILAQLAPAQEEGLMVTRQRQRDLLRRAEQACVEAGEALGTGLGPELVVEHVREALSALDEVTGQRFTEDVLDAVFSAFCIGK
jgi:tRNA modification GTPase